MALLNNIKVIDLTRFVAGPHCTLVLSDLGAEVIKIEKPGKGDDLRIIGPKLLETSLWAAVLNRGKKSVSLDLKTKIGREILLKLIQEADVLVENFRPGVMEKLKLGWNTIKKVNNKLVMARISGYGQNDPILLDKHLTLQFRQKLALCKLAVKKKTYYDRNSIIRLYNWIKYSSWNISCFK